MDIASRRLARCPSFDWLGNIGKQQHLMKRVFGLETEYGITLSGAETVDVVAESIELVRRYTENGALMKWDYELEDPHLDARGFRARELLQDTDESAYYEIDKRRPLSFEEIKSDLVLSNGARFYNDHAHPEYSTPECTALHQIVAQDKAGERILAECARRRNQKLPPGYEVRLYKNNTDFAGHSYGCHDNYLMSRDIAWDRIVAGMLPFLITRQIFAGAGKMGIEAESVQGEPGVYQISQRADFFRVVVSIDTMNRRPLINTRDEPHVDASRYRRFHVILGDSNMSEWATAMKVGTTALMLDLIERGEAPQLEIAQPVDANKSISRDQTYDWIIELKDGRKISAIDVQRIYLRAASKLHPPSPGFGLAGDEGEREWILHEWENVLNDLERDVMSTRDRVDWAAKKFLLDALQEEEKLAWSDPWLQSIDLEYHNLDLDRGLYYELLRKGLMRRVTSEDEIRTAIFSPPETTRAFFRGRAVARFNDEISSIQWDEIVFTNGAHSFRVALPEAAMSARLDALNHAARNGKDFAEFMHAVAQID
jgi:Pup amidohydrolase